MSNSANKPEWSMRLRGVSAADFRNFAEKDGKKIPFHKVQLQRTYKDESTGEFKTTNSLSRDDLPVAILLLQKAYEHILTVEAEESKREKDEE